jgi:type II secretory pathway component GspD/PulD (secretin)
MHVDLTERAAICFGPESTEETAMQVNQILLATFLLGISLSTAAQPPAARPIAAQPTPELVSPPMPRAMPPLPDNAPTVDMFALIDRLADDMDKEFILDPRMGGLSGLSTAGDEADYETLLAVLRSNGFAAIEVGDQIRIVPDVTARTEPSPVIQQDDSRISDHAVVTRVIDIADVKVSMPDGSTAGASAQLVPVLRPLMSTAIGNIMLIPGSDKLIVVDRYDNVRRITAIVDELRQ